MENQNDKAAFLGKVTASITHELQNVLAIIKENSGLMEDYLLMNQTGELSDIEDRLGKCIKTIKNQTYRGVNLTSGLNGFAHTTDRILSSVNIYEITKKLIFITKRLFKQKGVSVSLIECKKTYSITTDPILFQMVIFSAIECLIENFDANSSITLDIQASLNQGLQHQRSCWRPC